MRICFSFEGVESTATIIIEHTRDHTKPRNQEQNTRPNRPILVSQSFFDLQSHVSISEQASTRV